MDDIPMENAEGADNSPAQVATDARCLTVPPHIDHVVLRLLQEQVDLPEKMAEFVNTRVYELLKEKMKGGNTMMKRKDVMSVTKLKQLVDANMHNLLELQLCTGLKFAIQVMYGVEVEVVDAVAKETTDEVVRMFGVGTSSAPKLTSEDVKRLEIAFTQTKYIGNASSKFKEYLERCWKMHCKNPKLFKAPYVAVIQSSGFGKSRMLFELAHMTRKSSSMKVLYVCARTQVSTGYPEATKELRNWLFPTLCTTEMIATRLKVIFQYAVDNWASVDNEWLELFTSTKADNDVTEKLKTVETMIQKMSLAKKTSTIHSSQHSLSEKKVVILVIDEAKSLLAEGKNSLNHFRMLRQALHSAISTDGGVFGVLVDTNLKIAEPTPPVARVLSDPSSRLSRGTKLALFPPFVLTHMMDVFWQKHCDEQAVRGEKMRDNDAMVVDMQDEAGEAADEMADSQMPDSSENKRDDVADDKSKVCDGKKETSADEIAYKDAVTGSEQDAWNALVRMGWPMWYSTFTDGLESQANVVNLAANKLLLGHPPGKGSYMEDNMFGIASLLCRVGLRPYSTAPFAPRAVTDLVAILAYVNYEIEGYVSSYASDPVLTLGAKKVWYEQTDALAKFILPQLKKLILDEALDTGGIGEMVARIVLLLAMDKCVTGYTDYVGQFIPVHAFLEQFGLDDMPVFMSRMRAATDETKNAFRTWLSKRDGWRMGFTHFVQLRQESTEETLWYLLGRRAAGILPRNQKEADLLIPIFWKKTDGEAASESEIKTENAVDAKVSLILIQVKNRSPHDSEFLMSATTKLCPSFVFGGKLKKPKKVPANNSSVERPAKGWNKESIKGLSIGKCVTVSSVKKSVEDSPSKKLENPLSNKSVRVCIYMNVQEEDSKHHRFIYANEIGDENKSNDGSEIKLVDTSGKKKKCNSMEAASISTLGERKTRSNVHKSKTHGRKRKVGVSRAESVATASGSNDSKTKAASELRFTFYYRSVRCDTYKFLDTEVAGRLASLVETLWDPLVLVDGDLKRRQEVEQDFENILFKVVLSQAMGDEELKIIACKGLTDPSGRHKASVKKQDKKQQSFDEKRD